jgi:hypothetical protein
MARKTRKTAKKSAKTNTNETFVSDARKPALKVRTSVRGGYSKVAV